MRRQQILAAALLVGLLTIGGAASAITLEVVPQFSNAVVGDSIDVAINISGLGAFTPPSLGGFDLNLTFDSDILGFTNVSYGDPVLGDQLDLFALGSLTETTPSDGFVNLFELSLDSPADLETLQPDDFVLATITFNALTVGASTLGLTVNALADAEGLPLVADAVVGAMVNAVPLPPSIWLLGTGTALLIAVPRLKYGRRRPAKSTS